MTDLRIHKGNLIAATSGRSLWILDDLADPAASRRRARPGALSPDEHVPGQWRGELDGPGDSSPAPTTLAA